MEKPKITWDNYGVSEVKCHQSCCLLPKNNPLHTGKIWLNVKIDFWSSCIINQSLYLVQWHWVFFVCVCISSMTALDKWGLLFHPKENELFELGIQSFRNSLWFLAHKKAFLQECENDRFFSVIDLVNILRPTGI